MESAEHNITNKNIELERLSNINLLTPQQRMFFIHQNQFCIQHMLNFLMT